MLCDGCKEDRPHRAGEAFMPEWYSNPKREKYLPDYVNKRIDEEKQNIQDKDEYIVEEDDLTASDADYDSEGNWKDDIHYAKDGWYIDGKFFYDEELRREMYDSDVFWEFANNMVQDLGYRDIDHFVKEEGQEELDEYIHVNFFQTGDGPLESYRELYRRGAFDGFERANSVARRKGKQDIGIRYDERGRREIGPVEFRK